MRKCESSIEVSKMLGLVCLGYGSAAAWAVCFEGSVAAVSATDTGNEVSLNLH